MADEKARSRCLLHPPDDVQSAGLLNVYGVRAVVRCHHRYKLRELGARSTVDRCAAITFMAEALPLSMGQVAPPITECLRRVRPSWPGHANRQRERFLAIIPRDQGEKRITSWPASSGR